MFFPGAKPAPIPCVQHLMGEVLALGAADVVVERRQDWWIVSSTFDWFVPDESADEQTRKLIPLPEMGPNASRVEVVLLAFAEAVATLGADQEWRSLSGPGLVEGLKGGSSSKVARALAFRFSSS